MQAEIEASRCLRPLQARERPAGVHRGHRGAGQTPGQNSELGDIARRGSRSLHCHVSRFLGLQMKGEKMTEAPEGLKQAIIDMCHMCQPININEVRVYANLLIC